VTAHDLVAPAGAVTFFVTDENLRDAKEKP